MADDIDLCSRFTEQLARLSWLPRGFERSAQRWEQLYFVLSRLAAALGQGLWCASCGGSAAAQTDVALDTFKAGDGAVDRAPRVGSRRERARSGASSSFLASVLPTRVSASVGTND